MFENDTLPSCPVSASSVALTKSKMGGSWAVIGLMSRFFVHPRPQSACLAPPHPQKADDASWRCGGGAWWCTAASGYVCLWLD